MGIREEMRDNLNIISNMVKMKSDYVDLAGLVHSHFCYVGYNLLDIIISSLLLQFPYNFSHFLKNIFCTNS